MNTDIFTKEGIIQNGFMELSASVDNSPLSVPNDQLLIAADETQIHTFGWPIGVVLHVPDLKPRSKADGIEAEIKSNDCYDYWCLKQNGNYYYIGSFFEDSRVKNKLYIDTRIIRITEGVWRIVRLYKWLKVPLENTISFCIRHGGLKGRTLAVASPSRIFMTSKICYEDMPVTTKFSCKLNEFVSENNEINVDAMKKIVLKLISDVTILFDYYKPAENVVYEIVDSFLKGRIS